MHNEKLSLTDILSLNIISVIIPVSLILFTFGTDTSLFYINWVVGVLVLGSVTISILFIKLKINKTSLKVFIFMNMWLIYAIIITPVAKNLSYHISFILLTIFYNGLGLYFINKIIESPQRFALTIVGLNILWVFINTFAMIFFFLTSVNQADQSFSGIFANRNQFAVVTTLLFTFTLFYKKYFRSSIPVNILMIINIIMIFTSLSRKGFIGIILILFLYNWQRLKRVKKLMAIFAISILIIVTFITDNPLKERFKLVKEKTPAFTSERVELSAFERMWLLINGTKLFLEHPLTGVGVNNSLVYLETPMQKLERAQGDKMDKEGKYTHINYLEMLVNAGIPAFILYYVPILLIFGRVISRTKESDRYSMIAILLIYKLFLDMAMVSYYDFAHSLLLAYVFLAYLKAKPNSENIPRLNSTGVLAGE